jgi:hypothetical protein
VSESAAELSWANQPLDHMFHCARIEDLGVEGV